jgi:hypothetical protein
MLENTIKTVHKVKTCLGQNPALKPSHIEQQIRVVLRINAGKRLLPLNRGHRSGQTIFDVPENCSTTEIQQNQ